MKDEILSQERLHIVRFWSFIWDRSRSV